MFCQKCGTKNPDNGKFCRNCGTNLSANSNNLVEKFNSEFGNFNKRVNQFGMMPPLDPMRLRDKKGKPVHWESAMTKLFTGIAFSVVTIALAFTAMGTGWWFWMLIPAFSCLGAGIAQIMQLKSAERQRFSLNPNEITQEIFPPQKDLSSAKANNEWIEDLIQSGQKSLAIKIYGETYGVGQKEAEEAIDRISAGQTLPESTEEYIKPKQSIYDTGDLVAPPSVTEDTTRHLEMDSEGKTMTLPKK
ncbi:MAG: zinc ribbon domain-containing protein [Acidobacteriota bacterium]